MRGLRGYIGVGLGVEAVRREGEGRERVGCGGNCALHSLAPSWLELGLGMLALRPDHRKSLPPFVPALASPKAETPPQCAEQPPRCAEQPPRSEQRQQQQQPRTKGEAPRRVAAHHGSARSNKQQTLSDAQAIQRGTVGGTDGTGTSTPFWVEAGMRTAINRLCSVVLYAVGTGQLDLLHKCEASADQLQAHFRIPPWQSASMYHL